MTAGPKKKYTARKTTGGTSDFHSLDVPDPVQGSSEQPTSVEPSVISATPSQGAPETQVVGESSSHRVDEVCVFVTSSLAAWILTGIKWCALCGDGGETLVECNKCGRVNCAVCIPGLAGMDRTSVQSLDLQYQCPTCHGRRKTFFVCFPSHMLYPAQSDHPVGLVQGGDPSAPQGDGDQRERHISSWCPVQQFLHRRGGIYSRHSPKIGYSGLGVIHQPSSLVHNQPPRCLACSVPFQHHRQHLRHPSTDHRQDSQSFESVRSTNL